MHTAAPEPANETTGSIASFQFLPYRLVYFYTVPTQWGCVGDLPTPMSHFCNPNFLPSKFQFSHFSLLFPGLFRRPAHAQPPESHAHSSKCRQATPDRSKIKLPSFVALFQSCNPNFLSQSAQSIASEVWAQCRQILPGRDRSTCQFSLFWHPHFIFSLNQLLGNVSKVSVLMRCISVSVC